MYFREDVRSGGAAGLPRLREGSHEQGRAEIDLPGLGALGDALTCDAHESMLITCQR